MSAAQLPRTLPAAVASLLLLLGASPVQASEATNLAQRAGFLLGHAVRCGIPAARIEASAAVMDGLITAYSASDDDELAARSDFIKLAVASARGAQLGDPLPSCGVVRAQLALFEQHYQMREAETKQQPRRTAQ